MAKKNDLIIATYNIQFAINKQDIVNNIAQMAQNRVQVFCLQEIINTPNDDFIIDVILKRLGGNWQAIFYVGNEPSRLSIGTAIVWNDALLKLQHAEKIALPKIVQFDLHERFYYKVIGVPGVPLQRRAITGYFSYGKKQLRITSVHIDNVGGPRHRMKQISYLLAKFRTLTKAQTEIICGDFNTFDLLKTGYEKKLLQKKLGKEFVDASKNVGWTSDIYLIDFHTSIKLFPWIIKTFHIHIRRRLDYIWTKNLQVISCNKLQTPGSDHLPIVAKLQID